MSALVDKIEGIVPIELPGGKDEEVMFEMTYDGDVVLRFHNREFTTEFMETAIRGKVLGLTLNYSYAVPIQRRSNNEG